MDQSKQLANAPFIYSKYRKPRDITCDAQNRPQLVSPFRNMRLATTRHYPVRNLVIISLCVFLRCPHSAQAGLNRDRDSAEIITSIEGAVSSKTTTL